MYDPSALQQNVQPPQSAGYPNENQYHAEPQPSGWNDPPIMKSAKAQVCFKMILLVLGNEKQMIFQAF